MSKEGLAKAYELALACDPVSAFGGIVGFNGRVTKELAEKLIDIFLEAVVAPSFDKGALEAFEKKKNLRVMAAGEELGHNPLESPFEIKKGLGRGFDSND